MGYFNFKFSCNCKKTTWDCAIWGINRVIDGSCKACTFMSLFIQTVNIGKDPYDNAKGEFKKKYPNVLYDFLNLNHRIFIGQQMAKYLRIEK